MRIERETEARVRISSVFGDGGQEFPVSNVSADSVPLEAPVAFGKHPIAQMVLSCSMPTTSAFRTRPHAKHDPKARLAPWSRQTEK